MTTLANFAALTGQAQRTSDSVLRIALPAGAIDIVSLDYLSANIRTGKRPKKNPPRQHGGFLQVMTG
ncbi:MAG: hypothetical protein AB8B97_14865 [Granulosicoccus sp.]